MNKIFPMLFVVMILATGCPQPEPEVHKTEFGLFTPYAFFPEILNGKVKEVVEKNYIGIEEEGKIIKGERLTVAARDSISWTNDFKVVYDEAGNVLKSILLDENDENIQKSKSTIEDGRVIKNESIRDDTLNAYTSITYDEAGQVSKIERFGLPADTLLWSVRLLSDENGNFKEWHWTDWSRSPSGKHIFTVNQEGLRTGFKFYNKDGEVALEQAFTYNEMGFLTKQVITTEEEESVSEYEYDYDEKNNWIKVIATTNGQTIVTERTYTYFE